MVTVAWEWAIVFALVGNGGINCGENDNTVQQLAMFRESRSIQERFEEYDQAHPEVFAYMLKISRRVKQKGYNRFSIRTIWEQMRWYFLIKKDAGADFKLNDHFHSRYARKLMQEHPEEFQDFFETRELRS